MDRLILLRHGKAEPDSESGDDVDRRLTPTGVRESAEMGAQLAQLGFRPDVALVSPAARARETWEAVRGAFPGAKTRLDDELYHADPRTILREAEAAGRQTVMVVGHNPGMQELTVMLLTEGGAPSSLVGRARRDFPTAAAAVFLFDAKGLPYFDGLFFPER